MANTINKDFLLFERKYFASLRVNCSSLENVYTFWYNSVSISREDVTLKLLGKGMLDGSP